MTSPDEGVSPAPAVSRPGRWAFPFAGMGRATKAALVTFVLSAAVGAMVATLAEKQRVAERERAALAIAAEHASALQQQIYRSLSITDALAGVVHQGVESPAALEAVARDLLPRYPGVSALQVAPGGVVRMSVPIAGHERAIGHDLLADPARNKEAFLALRMRRLTLAGPFELMQGGVAIVGRLPIFETKPPERFWGFATAIMRIGDLLATSRLEELPKAGYAWELSRRHPDSGERHSFGGHGEVLRAVSHEFDVPNGRWTLSIAPRDGWSNPREGAVTALLALAGAILAAWLAWIIARQPELLELTVAARTKEIGDTMLMLEATNVLLEREIRQHTQTQDALEASNERFRNLVEATSDWVWEVDENGVYTYVSPKIRDLLGYEPKEIIGRTPFDLMPPAEAARVKEAFGRLAAQRQPFALMVNTNRHKDGRAVVLETSGIPVFDGTGHFRGYRGIDRDISHRVMSEERIRKLSRVVEQTANAVMITDMKGVIEYVNPKFCEITGYAAHEVLGMNPRLLKSGEQPPEVYAEMWEALRTGAPWMGEFHNRRKDGSHFWCLQSVSAIRGESGEITHFVSVMEDIGSRKHAESTIRRLAYYDTLTGLPNRRLFLDRFGQAIATARRSGDTIAILYLDVDRLKNVNDSLGHAVGDALIRAVGERVAGLVRKDDTVARLEGDEFAVLAGGVGDMHGAAHAVEQLSQALRKPFLALGHELFVTCSIGVALYPQDGTDIDQLNRNADIALHQAKTHGDSFRFFTAGMTAKVEGWLSLENQLRRAVEMEEFDFALQPQVDITAGGRITGAEALLRWKHPDRGPVPTSHFIHLAEETGLIVPIGRWMLRSSCRYAAEAGGDWRVSVNLAARQFHEGDELVQTVREALEESGLAPHRLELELTESALMENPHGAIDTMKRLAELGATLAIDDFGTGYSSLAYLKQMPVKVLKIDGSFVRGVAAVGEDRAIVKAVIALARELGLRTIAEGVETREQLEVLRELGCTDIQGFLFSRPVARGEFARLVETGATLS